jgi:hypothetical protein
MSELDELTGLPQYRPEKEKCVNCGLVGHGVEARGIWYCPNPLCGVCGAAWFRAKLDSYQKLDNDSHTVHFGEWEEKGFEALKDMHNDIVYAGIWSAARRRAKWGHEEELYGDEA